MNHVTELKKLYRHMKRAAFKMQLLPGFAEEYKKRHDEIWPELKRLLKESGVSEYSIFLDEQTNILFAFQKVSIEGGSEHLGQTEIVKKWWNFMSDIMEVNEDNSPVTIELKEVFYLD
jgi:L-rhamnose mutarotase